MKHVGIDGQTFAIQPLGGISRYFSNLLSFAKSHRSGTGQMGEPVDVFPAFTRHKNLYLQVAEIGLYCPQISLEDLFTGEIHLLADGTRAVYPQPDVIHSTYYADFPHNSVHRTAGVKLVSSLFDMIPECFPGFFAGGNPHLQKMEWLEASDSIVSISEASSADLLDHRPHLADRLHTIHLANALPELDSSNPLSNPLGVPYFLYVGARGGYKNEVVVLKALCRCQSVIPDYGLVFVGGPPSPAEQKLIEELGLAAKILFISPNDQELATLYASAAAVLVPSLAEGFSLPLVEALAFDTPVLCSDLTVHREVGSGFCTFLSPLKTQDWSDAMAEVASLRSPTDRLGTDYTSLKTYYSFPRVYEDHIALYQSL